MQFYKKILVKKNLDLLQKGRYIMSRFIQDSNSHASLKNLQVAIKEYNRNIIGTAIFFDITYTVTGRFCGTFFN